MPDGSNFQYVTLVPQGGTPVTLADAQGSPYATTGMGALVFNLGPTIDAPIFTGDATLERLLLPDGGNQTTPAILIGDDAGIFSTGPGVLSFGLAGGTTMSVTNNAINVVGDVAYSGELVGAFHTPLTTEGDLYYRDSVGPTRLPRGAAGTVLASNGTTINWVVAGAGTVSSISEVAGETVATPNPIVGVGTIGLADTTVAPGGYGSATQSIVLTVDAKGRLLGATNVTVTPAVGSITGLGTGIAAALAINVGSAGAPVLFNGAGGTPSSINLANGTALPIAGIAGLSAGIDAWLAVASSANLRAAMTDEIGTGALVFDGATFTSLIAGPGTLTNLIIRVQSFLASGTYTPHASMVAGYAVAKAGGGGGNGTAGDATNSFAAGGGGEGNTVVKYFVRSDVAPTTSVTIGAGGTGVTAVAGTAGGDTTFGALITAKGGGVGGGIGNGYNGGLPNTVGNVGDVVTLGLIGGNGAQINTTAVQCGGNGGGSGGGRGAAPNFNAAAVGNNGAANSGGGGGGACCNAFNTAGAIVAGGDGGSGYLYVVECCTA